MKKIIALLLLLLPTQGISSECTYSSICYATICIIGESIVCAPIKCTKTLFKQVRYNQPMRSKSPLLAKTHTFQTINEKKVLYQQPTYSVLDYDSEESSSDEGLYIGPRKKNLI
ncbi:MAG: hypothetical protein ACJAZS_000033 [Alteromonas naphthalenivorans]|jgi:hypothetical protein